MIEKENRLGTGSIGGLIARYAIPSVIAMLVGALYNIVDQVFIGHSVGYLGNGAANVVGLLTLSGLAVAVLLGDGTAADYSLNLGKGDKGAAAEAVGSMAVALFVLSAAVLVVGSVFLTPILRLFGGTDAILPLALRYGRIIVLGLPLAIISTALNAVIRADGSPRYAMTSMIAGAVANTCMDPLFIFGFGWGIEGAALSTVLAQLLSFFISLSYFRHFQEIKVTRDIFHVSRRTLGRIAALGIPTFLDQVTFTLVMAVSNNLIVHYGALSPYGREIPLTAFGLAMKVQEILFTVILGIAIGMQPVVGYNYGAKKFPRVRQAYRVAVTAAIVLSIAATVVFVFFPEPLVRIFGSQEETLYLEFSKKFFQTYFCMYIFFGFEMVTGILFQAMGKPRQAAAISLLYQVVFKIGSALLLTAAVGLDGVLLSGPVSDILIFLVCLVMLDIQLKALRKEEGRIEMVSVQEEKRT
ncbi:MATE family efflux transporter [Zongyangia hominis]|uniref:Multidrug export protein MepA n=1 Tax=Zongyangia hominis TaxID=2763677 RepID=A0A926E8N3_9FIRM|nr:MATE family efflux transporter [Zongyangia hominis]MBC8569233.1 MATE family efflux transporter [Zongyangia hominis]